MILYGFLILIGFNVNYLTHNIIFVEKDIGILNGFLLIIQENQYKSIVAVLVVVNIIQ